MAKRALLVLAEGFEEIEAVTVIDLLRRAGVELITAGLTDREVAGAHGIRVGADTTFAETEPNVDAIILPGGQPGATHLGNSEELLAAIRRAHAKGTICAAICAAPSVLAKAGIIEGKNATCFPGVEQQLTGAHVSEEPVVVDGTVVTSRGVGTAIAFSLSLIARLVDGETARTMAQRVLYAGEWA
jgi:protein deglycase